ncbi:MAG: metallophosphoesterase family protein [Candidatus Omnitrophica bacterium]|nr:metallophosphoesterase family protein [Candidatus Omnitrophota bacterium]
MRYAVLSDIHGNLEALNAVLAHLTSERIDRYLCLGDVVGYGADPGPCLERLQACEAVIVAGNHEAACVGKLDLDWFNEMARDALRWTRDRLRVPELDLLRRLPLTEVVEPFTLVHASLVYPDRFHYLVDAAQAIETMAACRTLICLAGHTHVAGFMEYDRSRRRLTQCRTTPAELVNVTFEDRPETQRYLINPGSVGQPRDGDPRASCLVIDAEQQRVSVHRVPYDVGAAQQKIRSAGLPAFLADRLAVGR